MPAGDALHATAPASAAAAGLSPTGEPHAARVSRHVSRLRQVCNLLLGVGVGGVNVVTFTLATEFAPCRLVPQVREQGSLQPRTAAR